MKDVPPPAAEVKRSFAVTPAAPAVDDDYWTAARWSEANSRVAARRGAMKSLDGDSRGCGSVACRSAWTPPWKSRQHPVFEGKWACSNRCLLSLVKAAILREAGDGSRDGIAVQHHHRVPLGLIMLAQGWITHPQLQKALESQRANGQGRIGDWLVSECGLASEWVTRGLSVQWNCPVLTTDGFSPEMMAMALPKVFIEEYGILPLKIAGTRVLYVGFQDHLDASSAFAVEQMNGLRTESGVVAETRFKNAREQLLASQFAQLTQSVVRDTEALANSIATLVDQKETVAARLVRLHQYYWLRIWHSGGAYRVGGNVPANRDDAHDFIFTVGVGARMFG